MKFVFADRLLGLYVGTQKNASLRVYSVNKGQVSLKSDVVVHEEDSDDEADILIDGIALLLGSHLYSYLQAPF
jgi:hypothetical protein